MIDRKVRRPNPARWLAYAFGAGLPAAHREWVLHDTTARAWQLRHLARTAVQLAPFAIALYVFIPGEPWVRGVAVLAGLLLGFFYSAAYMYETVEHRVIKAGYPRGTAAGTRAALHADDDSERALRYERQWRDPR